MKRHYTYKVEALHTDIALPYVMEESLPQLLLTPRPNVEHMLIKEWIAGYDPVKKRIF